MTAGLSWVTKSNLTDWLRCPYSFWLADSGQITRDDMFSPFVAQLIQAGIDFEAGILANAAPLEMPPGGEAELFAGYHTIVGTRGFENETLRLKGRPDGIVTANGALEPIEIKAHRDILRSDRIELAFYWVLLAPYRTTASHPAGWMFLRQPDGTHSRTRVPLGPDLIAEVERLIGEVRGARQSGVEPARCRCNVCSNVRRDEVTEWVRKRRHLSAIRGIGRETVQALGTAGYRTWDDLMEADAELLSTSLAVCVPPRFVSVDEVRRWQTHARALHTGLAQSVPDACHFPVLNEYVTLDLEYVPGTGPVWLTGLRAVRQDGDVTLTVWNDAANERSLFDDLDAFLSEHPGPIVTWNGTAADLPALRQAAARSGRQEAFERIKTRHIDLYDWLWRNLLLPISGFGIKDVADHLRIGRASDITSGLEALALWQRYNAKRDLPIRDRLIAYNRDDVDSLPKIVEEVRAINANTARPAAHRPVATAIERIHEQPRRTTRRRRLPWSAASAPRPGN